MATVASFSSSKVVAKLDADTAPDYAGDRLTRWTLTLGDDLCEVLEGMGHLDSAALRAI